MSTRFDSLEVTLNSSPRCSVRGSVCDITCWPQIANVFRESTRFGPPGVAPGLDHVVASAGIMGLPNFPPASSEVPSADDVPDQPSTTALEVNTKGALYITRLAQYYMSIPAPASTSPCDKSIILISSTGAYWPIPYADDYNASKGAVRALFQTLRGPFAGRGIRLNMIAPWLIRTPLSKDGISVLESAGYPICEPEVVVRAAMHLAADPTIVGRALQAGLCGVRDLRDDAEGLHGGLATKALIEEGLGGYEKLELIDASIVKGWGY